MSVQLTLHLSRTVSLLSETVLLHRVLGDWGQGRSDADINEGIGAAAAPNDATWLHRIFPSEQWQTPGGDFVEEPSATLEVGGIGTYTWGPTEQMVADVQDWVDRPSTNFGWLIKGNETEIRTTKRFDSMENPNEADRPMLTVEFTSASVKP